MSVCSFVCLLPESHNLDMDYPVDRQIKHPKINRMSFAISVSETRHTKRKKNDQRELLHRIHTTPSARNEKNVIKNFEPYRDEDDEYDECDVENCVFMIRARTFQIGKHMRRLLLLLLR